MFNFKEQLTSYIIAGHIHLSKKDYLFFSNVNTISKENRSITSNQNKLFDKLLAKYKKQLTKLNFDIAHLQNLPWQTGLIESQQEFLEAKIFIKDDSIIIKCPFNSKFIQQFRNVDLNMFVWNKEHKHYTAPFSTHNLKVAVVNVKKYYNDVKYCNQINDILDQLKEYENIKYWKPTLVKSNNNLYILGINEYLYESIKHIELTNDPKTLMLLSNHGIVISDEIFENDPFKIFAGSYLVEVDLASFTQISKWLNLLEVEHVFTANQLVYTKKITNDIKVDLLADGITCSQVGSTDHKNGVLLKTTNSLPSRINIKNISKIVHLVNSTPVHVK